MMTATVSEINSLINKIEDVLFRIEKWEAIASYFRIFEGEDVDEFRPEYDYEETQKNIAEINEWIRYLRLKISEAKINTYVEDYGMTFDELVMFKDDLINRMYALDNILGTDPNELRWRGLYGMNPIDTISGLDYEWELKKFESQKEDGQTETASDPEKERFWKEYEEVKEKIKRIDSDIADLCSVMTVTVRGTWKQWNDSIREKEEYINSITDEYMVEDHDRIVRQHCSGIWHFSYTPRKISELTKSMYYTKWWELASDY